MCVRAVTIVIALLALPGLSPQNQPKERASSLPSIAFVSRNPLPSSDGGALGAVPGLGPRYRTIAVGGKLLLRNRDGSLSSLVEQSQLYDVADPSVSWDGASIVFSGTVHPDSSWRIYRIGVDGGGFMQLTFTDRDLDLSQFGAAAFHFERYDDFDPCYLPDGRVVFASTRYPSMASHQKVLTSNLHVLSADGTIHRITTERNGGEEPTIDPMTGQVVYSRWWLNLDRPTNVTRFGLTRQDDQALTDDIGNVWQAVTIKPDGEGVKLYAGFPRTREGMHTYKPAILDDGRLLSVFSPDLTLTTIGGTGIRWFRKGADFEHHVIGVRPGGGREGARYHDPPFATDPVQLSGNTILFSYSANGHDYGLYTCRLDGSDLRPVLDLPGTLELDAQVVRRREIPPVLQDGFVPPFFAFPPTEDPATYGMNDFFRFDCMNVFANAAVDEPMPDAPRITRDARIRFFMNVQRQNPREPDPSIFLKEAPVFPTGGVHEPDVPADVPLFEQLVDANGRVLETTDGKFAHVPGFNFERVGAGTKCVGCHAGHSMMEVPLTGSAAEWINVSPSAHVEATSIFVGEEGKLFSPRRVVDRQARTGGDTVNWASSEGPGAYLMLSWEIPVEVRRFVLYNVKPQPRAGTSIVVERCEIVLFREGKEVMRVESHQALSQHGTAVDFPPTIMDAARVTITAFKGKFRNEPFAALAEIETIARIHQ